MTKLLFIFLFFSFSFFLYYIERSVRKCHVTGVTSHDKSHYGCGKIVHRPCSSCISSIQEIIGILLSSSC